MGAGALTLARSMGPAGQPVGSGRGSMIEEPGARADYQFAQDAVGSGRGSMLPNANARVAYEKAQALDAAKQRMAAIQATGDRVPMPPARPREGGLASLFSGPAYQSKGGELRQDGKINWGDSDSAADFFRADKARMETPDALGMNRGGAASGKPDKNEAIHRALDIISHLVGHRR